jgi:hypothetical protein
MKNKKSLLTGLFLCSFWVLHAQLLLKVTAIPANTPAGADIYVAGTFNNWNPGNPAYKLTSLGGGQYQISINPPVGQIKFKFTRGSWATVEGNASGGFLPDRTLTYNGTPATAELSVLSWEDLGGGGNSGGTAAPNVSVLDNAFFMPSWAAIAGYGSICPLTTIYNRQKISRAVHARTDRTCLMRPPPFRVEWRVD